MKFEYVVEHTRDLETTGRKRNEMYVELEKIFLCDDKTLPSADWIKPTISPDGRNAIEGAQRLLCAADPIWSVPQETNSRAIKKDTSRLERAAKAIWQNAGVVSGRPRHYDPILAALLYGEVQIPVMSTRKIVDETTDPKQKERWKRNAEKAPVMFDSINPREGYSAWGLGGLDAYVSKRSMLVGDVWSRYGSQYLADESFSRRVTVNDYWSLDQHVIWVDGQSTPIVDAPNPWPFIPIVSVLVDGSMMFSVDTEYQTRQPFLYTVWKTGIWSRQNLFLTLISSLAFEVGASPLLVFESIGEEDPVIQYDIPGGVTKIRAGEKLYPLMQKVISADLVEQAQIMDDRFTQSTIYRQVLGEPIGGNAPFSMVSLLSQAGRLPLVIPQKMLSFAFTQAIQMAFAMIREDGGTLQVSSKTGVQSLKASEIPEDFDIQATLDVSMPQDDRMNAEVALRLTEKQMVSDRYARERYLKIGQSDDMQTEIVEETYQKAYMQADLQAEIQRRQAAAAQQQQPPQQPPAGNVPPGIQSPDMAMGAGGNFPANFAQEGRPMMGPAEPPNSPMLPGAEGQNANQLV